MINFCIDADYKWGNDSMNVFRQKKNTGYYYFVLLAVIFLLSLLFPYSGDDWAWGSVYGLERLKAGFAGYNGRYFGNLIVLVLTRSNLLKALVMSLCITGIVVLLNELTERQECGLWMILLMFVFMPVPLLSQGIVWTSGFSNYVTSTFLTLVYIYCVKNISRERPRTNRKAIVPLFFLGVMNALIVENMTIFNVMLGLYVMGETYYRYHSICMQHLSYFMGAVSGSLLMFSNSAYSNIAKGEDAYRSFSQGMGIVGKAVWNYFNIISRDVLLCNYVLLCLLSIICIEVWRKNRIKLSVRKRIIGEISVLVIVCYTATAVINRISCIVPLKILLYAQGLATAMCAIALFVFVLIVPIERGKKRTLLFILICICCMVAPLFVVSPLGIRCFFSTYVMLIYFTIELYSCIDEEKKVHVSKCRNYLVACVLVGTLFLFYIFGTICKNQNQRVEKARLDVMSGKNTITVKMLPYNIYVWTSEPSGDPWDERFKKFYGINQSVKIKVVPH